MAKLQTGLTEIIGRKVAGHDTAGDLVSDAEAVAPLLGLAPGFFMEELRKGVLYQMYERGTEEDIGRSRVTFRYRAQQSVLSMDSHGRVLDVA
ncbi:DUF6522 family protein (plasmid) [Skermanella rosea]|uniref:DUF6522 family protein n=1 Tax=Skermanella rosea TaxID=1817965 RepID=UPI00193292B9|nr:DUF6522 family protein [Skermanella rosea]UEM07715.1 DUF6522 family protein [Skermanella rosea]